MAQEVKRANTSELEKWVQELAEETNSKLAGAQLYNVKLNLMDPSEFVREDNSQETNEQQYFRGSVSMYVKLAFPEPDFLISKDKEEWHRIMKKLVTERFGIGAERTGNLDFILIEFDESSEEELPLLTEKKKTTITEGFENAARYVGWRISKVKEYEAVKRAYEEAMKAYLSGL